MIISKPIGSTVLRYTSLEPQCKSKEFLYAKLAYK